MQEEKYKLSVLPETVKCRLAIEAGVTNYWWQYVGSSGDVIGIDTFGLSAPADELFEYFGFNSNNIFKRSKSLIEKNKNLESQTYINN
jgi:transketolase